MRTVLVSGSAQGLGINLVKAHLKLGDRVFAIDWKMTDELRLQEDHAPVLLTAIKADIGSTEEVEAAMDIIASKTDHLDVIYNNAAIYEIPDEHQGLLDYDLDSIKDKLNINAIGAMRVTKAALKRGLLKRGSVIMNTSSEAASFAQPVLVRSQESGYCMSKAALNRAMQIIQNEVADMGIRILLLHPGWMQTTMGGPGATQPPMETAKAYIKLVSDPNSSSIDNIYMWFDGTPIAW